MCYAEFAGRVPNAGSAYIYSYVAIGELIAFVIGWTLYIEHSISECWPSRTETPLVSHAKINPEKNSKNIAYTHRDCGFDTQRAIRVFQVRRLWRKPWQTISTRCSGTRKKITWENIFRCEWNTWASIRTSRLFCSSWPLRVSDT